MPSGRGFLDGGGDAGALMRSRDWSGSALGDPERWPQALRASVSICLGSRYPMFLWWGPELTNLYNDAYAPLMGTKHPDGMGRPAREVWAEIWDIVGPLAEGVIERGEATWSAAQRLDLERSGYPEETYFDFAYSPVYGEDGTVAGVLGVVSEITGRVLAERRLRTLSEIAARARGADGLGAVALAAVHALEVNPDDLPFALLYEQLDGGAALIGASGPAPSADGHADVVERVLHTRAPTTIGDHALVLAVQESAERAPTLALVCGLSRHRALDAELRQFCELVASAIGRAVGEARALEEERARAEALAELDRAKTEFFSNVSHEFRTPLTLLLGPLEEAAKRPDPDPELVMAHRNALRLLRHVNTLLEYSRVQANRAKADPRPIDLASICGELASVFRSAIERAGLALELECRQLSAPALADAAQLEQIVLNLLSNALKFTFAGRIAVRVGERDGFGVIEIEDTGVGIAERDLERLFERFHRVAGERTRSHEGSGIGLALSKELAELQGGTIEVASREGVGSKFTVLLPLAAAGQGAERAILSRHAEAFVAEALRWGEQVGGTDVHLVADPEAPRVLVVDDNADMRAYLSRLLGERYRVHVVTDGREALELLHSGGPFDLVLTDVMMPGLGGFGLLARIRADHALAGTPVVMLSARAGEEAAVEGLDAGADDYVVKPFSARELLARVAANLELGALRNREAQRAADYAVRLEELLDRERAIAVTLQRSMLPGQLDVGAFTRVGARYEPAQRAMQVGGDFYDALPLTDGRTLLFIGDVAGHGLESAVIMGAMRAALHAYVLRDAAPDRLLVDLNVFARTRPGTLMVTCACVVIDADGFGASYAVAGHPPVALRRPDGRVELLAASAGPPLGVQTLPNFQAARVELEPGSTLVLYTDGLVERRGEPLDVGIERLTAALGTAADDDGAALADRLVAAQCYGEGYEDDVAVLIATLEDPSLDVELELPATPAVLQPLRRTVHRWLAAHGVDAVSAYDIVFAANEAAANVVEHAYGLRDGSLSVRLAADAGTVRVTLADRGHWRAPRGGDGGRGLELMRSLMDQVEVRRTPDGSTVELAKHL